jgi:hypothetical protein
VDPKFRCSIPDQLGALSQNPHLFAGLCDHSPTLCMLNVRLFKPAVRGAILFWVRALHHRSSQAFGPDRCLGSRQMSGNFKTVAKRTQSIPRLRHPESLATPTLPPRPCQNPTPYPTQRVGSSHSNVGYVAKIKIVQTKPILNASNSGRNPLPLCDFPSHTLFPGLSRPNPFLPIYCVSARNAVL